MKFSIVIHGAPWSANASLSALRFTEAALDCGHEIVRLFFYQDGASNGSSLCVPPQDEIDIPGLWQALIKKHEIDAVVCAASALKRGIIDKAEADRYEKNVESLLAGFSVSGLGQLIDACGQSDRVVSFVM